MPVAGDAGAVPLIPQFLHPVAAVALDHFHRGVGHVHHDARVADLPVHGEEDLIPGLRFPVIAPLHRVVLRRVHTRGAKVPGLSLDSLSRLGAEGLEEAPVDEHVAPGVPVFVPVVIARGCKVAGIFCPVAAAGVGEGLIKPGVRRLLPIADLPQGDSDKLLSLFHRPRLRRPPSAPLCSWRPGHAIVLEPASAAQEQAGQDGRRSPEC